MDSRWSSSSSSLSEPLAAACRTCASARAAARRSITLGAAAMCVSVAVADTSLANFSDSGGTSFSSTRPLALRM